jgi:predicted transcriptional regulator of viral defense system
MGANYSIANWIHELPAGGEYCFSRAQIVDRFPDMKPETIARALTREVQKKHIFSPQQGFYVIIPDEFKARGVVPQGFYMDSLMKHLRRNYYVALLNAADMHGAAHQAPMTFSVMTELPPLRDKETQSYITRFFCRTHIPSDYVERRVVRTGYINISSAELTAVDLITFQHAVGGVTRAATVLAELSEKLHFESLNVGFLEVAPLASFQRLGYILDAVLEESHIADGLMELIKKKRELTQFVPLKPNKPSAGLPTDKRWKVIVNQQIEIDDL